VKIDRTELLQDQRGMKRSPFSGLKGFGQCFPDRVSPKTIQARNGRHFSGDGDNHGMGW
jgi:hypothetical protein